MNFGAFNFCNCQPCGAIAVFVLALLFPVTGKAPAAVASVDAHRAASAARCVASPREGRIEFPAAVMSSAGSGVTGAGSCRGTAAGHSTNRERSRA